MVSAECEENTKPFSLPSRSWFIHAAGSSRMTAVLQKVAKEVEALVPAGQEFTV